MAKRSTLKPKRRVAKLAARNPRRTGRAAWGVAKTAGRKPRALHGGARLLGRSARGGTKLWAKGKTAKVAGRGGTRALRAPRRRRPARTRLVFTGALAALGAYFLDPKSGKHRRGLASDKAGKAVRRSKAETQSKARHAEGVAAGAAQSVGPSSERTAPEARLNDPSLARKVESEIFRDPQAPKGAVSVSVENGVVFLRGQLDDAGQREKLAAEARNVDGVREVQNLLHGPGESAPAKTDGGPGSGAA